MINLIKVEKVLSNEDKIDELLYQEFVLDMIKELKGARDKAELIDVLDWAKRRINNGL